MTFQTLVFLASGQPVKDCNIIYDYLEEMPKYKGGDEDLAKYIFDELIVVISKCEKEPLITSLYFSLIIQKDGQVGGVEFKRIQASEDCKSKIREKLMSMRGWIAGRKDGVAVCCRFSVPVQCIKWE